MSPRCLWPLVALLLLVVIGCEPVKQVTIEEVNNELQLVEPRLQLDYLRKKSTVDRVGDNCLLEGTDARRPQTPPRDARTRHQPAQRTPQKPVPG